MKIKGPDTKRTERLMSEQTKREHWQLVKARELLREAQKAAAFDSWATDNIDAKINEFFEQ